MYPSFINQGQGLASLWPEQAYSHRLVDTIRGVGPPPPIAKVDAKIRRLFFNEAFFFGLPNDTLETSLAPTTHVPCNAHPMAMHTACSSCHMWVFACLVTHLHTCRPCPTTSDHTRVCMLKALIIHLDEKGEGWSSDISWKKVTEMS